MFNSADIKLPFSVVFQTFGEEQTDYYSSFPISGKDSTERERGLPNFGTY